MVAEPQEAQKKSAVRWARPMVAVLLSSCALYLAARGVRWADAWAVMSGANLGLLAVASLSCAFTTWLKAVRWRLLFAPDHATLGLGRMVALVFAGQLANSVLPARLGDVARTYLGSDSLATAVRTGSTVVAEKAVDGAMLVMIAACVSAYAGLPSWLRTSTLTLSLLLALTFTLAVVVAYRGRELAPAVDRRTVTGTLGRVAVIARKMVQVIGELGALRSPVLQAQLWGLSFLIWTLAAVTNMLVFRSMGFGLQPLLSVVLLVVLMTGAIVPTVPAQLGVFHYLCVLSLSWFGFSAEQGLGYGLVLHLVVHAPIVAGGAIALWWLGLRARVWGIRRDGPR